MRFILFVALVISAGCESQQDKQRAEIRAAVERWESAYSSADAKIAFVETLAYADYLEKMPREGSLIDAPVVLVWIYPRLGLLAEHLGKKEEAARYFDIAVKHARAVYPGEPVEKSSEAAFRSALDQMDTPDTAPWRKAPNQSPQPTRQTGG